VVQRAVLDDPVLRGRVSHFLMFGTPSGGLSKAVIGSRLKNQAKDMSLGSTFIASLREEWSKAFSVTTPFHFRTVAGDRDAFVPASSSLDPFPPLSQDVVPGDHLSIVRPVSADSYSYQVLKKMVSPGPFVRSSVESARLAVEHLEFTEAIDTLLPNFEGLDDNAIVTLSLALESVGRREDALATLERWRGAHPECNLDARGALAGRLKRRWLTSRQKSDYDESIHLYTSALEDAEAIGDHSQAHYHAINIAYLLLEGSAIGSALTTDIALTAERALGHAQQCLPDRWALATSGEAYLILGDTEKALASYGAASHAAKTMREKDSMALQAISVASRLCSDAENNRLRELLNFPTTSLQKNG
jgi:tetratricopeptide (TPR) repeat protein